jgi:segregation and condensation protein B
MQATALEAADGDLAEIALLTGREDREKSEASDDVLSEDGSTVTTDETSTEPPQESSAVTDEEGAPSLSTAPPSPRVGLTDLSEAHAEAEAKRAARQRDREVREHLKKIVDSLIEEYANCDRGMEIREVAGGYRIATKPEYHDAVRAFVKSLKPPMKLSLQALETLAVIAYKQPITAPEVGEIRGVESGGVLGTLVSRKLIATAGRKQVIGRPILYKTTREFLLRFGLKDLNELPSIEEFEKLAGDLEIGDEEAAVAETKSEESTLPFDTTESELEEATEGTTETAAPSSTTVLSSSKVGFTEVQVEDQADENSPVPTEEEDHVRTS